MGHYAALDDPRAEPTIEVHLGRIVEAIRSELEPTAIILRGSFGRGEGSLIPRADGLQFLSDYEIDVATPSSRHRTRIRRLSRRLTGELGVATSLRWVRPDYLRTDRIGPIPAGPAPVTISLYESRYGSQTLYGRDLIRSSPDVDPARILPESGLILMLNRMAESLFFMGPPEDVGPAVHHWINKTILACAESLLVLWRSYHYLSGERGRRFAAMAPGRLDFMGGREKTLIELVDRATEFKLRPRAGVYQDPPGQTWTLVAEMVEPVFRHVVGQTLGIRFQAIEEFAGGYLDQRSGHLKRQPRSHVIAWTLLEAYRGARVRRLPRWLLRPVLASHVVYAAVPLAFMSYHRQDKSAALAEIRRTLGRIEDLGPPEPDQKSEWEDLRLRVARNWKVYCYG